MIGAGISQMEDLWRRFDRMARLVGPADK